MGGCCSPEAPQQGIDAPAPSEPLPLLCADEVEVTEAIYQCDGREDGSVVSEGDGVMEESGAEPQQAPPHVAAHCWVHLDEVTESQQEAVQEAQPSPKEEGGGRETQQSPQPQVQRYDALLTPEATSAARASERASKDVTLLQIDHEAREEEELFGVVRRLEWSSEDLPQPRSEERAPRPVPRTGRQKPAPQRAARQRSRQRGRAPEPGRQRPQRAGSRGAAAAAAPRSAASRRGSPRRSSQASEPGARRRREEGFAARRSPERRGAECTGDDLRQALRSRGALSELRANPVDNRGGAVHGARVCGAPRRELPRDLGVHDCLEMRLLTP
eukprot:TRINITY_DN14798_c0_g2_i14.p1 TRINITY_DN14798_c0_g2~~TRINITY_DN14798_c0_g2_i14.p1  ORF type:complete len:358 (+),score=84.20 TRINITY_DN14798_c0_g2_i14:88-1074(+)